MQIFALPALFIRDGTPMFEQMTDILEDLRARVDVAQERL